MKKLDYFIIGIGIAILLIIGIVIYQVNKVDKENVEIEVLYKSEVIYKLSLEDEGKYTIECVDNVVSFYKDNTLIKTINSSDKDFKNVFEIKNEKIEMLDATCEGKDCTKMYITKDHLIPIICTNGVVINPVTKSNVDVIA